MKFKWDHLGSILFHKKKNHQNRFIMGENIDENTQKKIIHTDEHRTSSFFVSELKI